MTEEVQKPLDDQGIMRKDIPPYSDEDLIPPEAILTVAEMRRLAFVQLMQEQGRGYLGGKFDGEEFEE